MDAVKGISFNVEKGEVFGFLGANGAGKSTTINMVTTQLLPTSGQFIYDGQDLTGDVASIRRRIGVVAQHNNLERSLTAEEPEILFLDEPTTGLDPNYRNILWDQMLKMNREGTTIFLTTHYMEEVENFCRHVAIMKKGEMLAYGTVKELEEKTGTSSLNDVFLVLTNRDGVDERTSANVEA